VPDSDSAELARHFRTRNSDLIIDGLGKLMEDGIERYFEGKKNETIAGELDPNVSRMGDKLFSQGVQLAKLVDPSLRTSAVAVNIAANQASVGVGTAAPTTHQLAAQVIGQLEAGGLSRSQITEDVVRRALQTANMPEFIQRELEVAALPAYIEVEEL